ncbi:hypothetical protein L1049_001243 [Liquidambar formosana]|uniref:Uncharacterized protein n=1 Tax=Liquidambar formosana TaxID=63359 RepID=A0AAP0NB59_LIQFO
MEQIESNIKGVLREYQKLSSTARSEEARIDGLNKEIELLEDRIRAPDSSQSERHRMQNLLTYHSTLIDRASSRTDLLRVLHEDLLFLFTRRTQLRNSDGAGGSGVDAMPNVSFSSGLSSGDDENQGFMKNCSMFGSMHTMRMSDHGNLEEETTADQQQMPLGVKLLQINMNEDACLTPEDGSEYCDDLQCKNNILDNIAMSILAPNANVDNILKEAMENSNFPCEESEGSKKVHGEMGSAANHNIDRQLTVDFDETGNPTGANSGAFKRSINSYVCEFLPIRFKQIGEIPVENYKSVVNALTDKYIFDITKSYTRKKISSCYRQHKYKLLVQVKKDLEIGLEPQKPSYVNEEDWNAFVAKTKDDEFDKISKKNKASRSQQSALSRKGMPSTIHKRKLKGSDQGPEDNSTWMKVNKPKRGRPRKLLAVVEDNQSVIDTIVLPVDQEVVQPQVYFITLAFPGYGIQYDGICMSVLGDNGLTCLLFWF